jgi:hypothetical protein
MMHYIQQSILGNLQMQKLKKHRVVLTGDSHIKNSSENISNLLDDSYNMNGITKPNANLEAITSPTDFNVDGYKKNDVVILSGGTMDVARNETNNGIRYVTHFLNRTVNTTVIIILDVPHHFDLVNSSCVNTKNIVFKRKLQKIVKTSNYMEIQNMIQAECATLSVECI